MIPGRRPTFSDSGGMAVPPFESQVCRPTVTLGRPGTWDVLGQVHAWVTGGYRAVLNHGDQGENLIPPSLILIPDAPDIPEVPSVPSGARITEGRDPGLIPPGPIPDLDS
jgi:hypothetical protein